MELRTLRSIVEALGQPALVLSPGYRVRVANADAERFFERDVEGLDVARILRQPEIRRLLERVSDSRDRQTETIVIHRNVPRSIQVAIGPLRNGEPEEMDFLMTLTDVSGQVDAERSRSTFVANVSHELRSPLTTLLGAVETLQGPARDRPDARERFLRLMHTETQRMSRLVADLLNLAKQEAQEHVRPDRELHLDRLLKQVASALEASESYQGGRLQLNLSETPTVRGAEDDLFEAFRNIVENALRYSPPESPVTIRLRHSPSTSPTHGERVVVEVEDHGDGIDAEHVPRLTDRFYRVDKGRSREMGGTGLGLAIVKHIVNRHRGRLNIRSEPGVGTTVTVTLPV